MGGEKGRDRGARLPRLGSPPRGRGKDAFKLAGLIVEGITPAWAGKSVVDADDVLLAGDHPRVGGEKLHGRVHIVSGRGSPPRGRGKASFRSGCRSVSRITPAWAGKSASDGFVVVLGEDHPRVGGEKFRGGAVRCGERGSPPRGRGKDPVHDELRGVLGITPAWAGKRRDRQRQGSPLWDHPRVGGEKEFIRPGLGQITGSPPRGRGKD